MGLNIWEVLNTEPTRDPEELKKAYRKQLVTVHPEDDPEGFQALRSAYEEAVRLSQLPEETEGAEEIREEDNSPRGELIRAMQKLYASFFQRVQVSEWEKVLDVPYVNSIDTSEDALYTVLDFLMEHFVVPHQVFRFISERLSLDEQREELLGRYPFRFLDYIQANAMFPDAVDFTLFRGPEDYDYDELISILSEFSRANKAGDLETQKSLLPKITDLPVENPDIDAMVCRYIWQTGEKEEAREKIAALAGEYPDVPGVVITYGDILQHSDDVDGAEECYRRAEKLMGSTPMIRGRLAEIMICRGEYEKARDTFFDLLQDAPYDGYFRSEVLSACEGIIREKTEHLEKEPEDIKCRVELAAALYQSYRFEEAVDLLLQVPAPENPIRRAGYYNYMGRSLLSIHRTEEALSQLQSWEEAIRSIPEADTSEEAIAVRKRHGYALTLIGVGYMQKKEYDTARTYIESAKGMHHDEYFVTLEESCVLEYLSGNYVESIEACKELELRAPQSFQSSNIRAKCCFRLGLLQEALENAERAMNIYPYVAEPYYTMAKCFLRMQAYPEVEKITDRYQEVNPESDTVCLLRAMVKQEEHGTTEDLIELLKPVLPHLKENNSDLEELDEFYRLMGDACAAGGRATDAMEYYQKATQENDRNPNLYRRLAALYKSMGRYEEALHAYQIQGNLEEDNRIFLNQAFCLMQMGQYQASRDAILRAVEESSTDAMNLMVSGRMLLDIHYAADALRILEQVEDHLENPKDQEELLVSKIRALILLRQYPLAEEVLQKVFSEGIRTKELVLQEIELYTQSGQFRKAEHVIRCFNWRAEEMSRKYDLLCRVHFQEGDLENLTRRLREAEELDVEGKKVTSPYQYELLGHLQMINKKYKEAEQSLLQAANLRPAVKYRYLGYMVECASRQFNGKGRVQRYMSHLEHFQRSGAESYLLKIRLAQGRRVEKSYKKAHLLLEEVLSKLPKNGEINHVVSLAYEELGWLYLAEKRNGEALLAFEEAENTRGYDASLKNVIKRLKHDSRN